MNRSQKVLRGLGLLALVLAVVAAASVVRWSHARNATDLKEARTRDAVASAAGNAAVELSTLDYREASGALDRWRSVATGTLAQTLASANKSYQAMVEQGQVTTQAEVRQAAVQRLAGDQRSAVVLVGLDVTLHSKSGTSVQKERLAVTMTQTNDGWKASAMKPVTAP